MNTIVIEKKLHHNEVQYSKFRCLQPVLEKTLEKALRDACKKLESEGMDLRCIDWFVSSSERSDYYRVLQKQKEEVIVFTK